MATALKLSETMIGALASVYNSSTPGKPNTMDALEKRGLITYKSGQVVITAEGREAIGADNDLIGVQDGEVVLYGSVQAFERSISADEIQEELNINPCDEISLPNRGKATISEEERATFAEMVEAFKGVGEGWSNTQVWDGLTRKEIQADIKTAIPDNRSTRRELARIQNNVTRRNWFRMSGESRKQARICGGKA